MAFGNLPLLAHSGHTSFVHQSLHVYFWNSSAFNIYFYISEGIGSFIFIWFLKFWLLYFIFPKTEVILKSLKISVFEFRIFYLCPRCVLSCNVQHYKFNTLRNCRQFSVFYISAFDYIFQFSWCNFVDLKMLEFSYCFVISVSFYSLFKHATIIIMEQKYR